MDIGRVLTLIAQEQAAKRALNERPEGPAAAGAEGEPVAFVCECAYIGCREALELTRGEYERVRASPLRFFVLGRHVIPEAEAIVEEHPDWVVVEKRPGPGADVAARTGAPASGAGDGPQGAARPPLVGG